MYLALLRAGFDNCVFMWASFRVLTLSPLSVKSMQPYSDPICLALTPFADLDHLLGESVTVALLSFISSAKSAVKFCGFGITFAEISFCTCLENSIKETINIMKPKHIFNIILAVLFVFPLMGTFAQQAANSGSIEVITTFDYPGTGIVTTSPQKINDRGDIVGEFIDSNGVVRGFVRFSDGSFSAPIVDPNDTVGFTEGRGINILGTVCGDYATSDGNSHGFFLSGGTFTEYDVPGATNTVVLGINDVADFSGGFDPGTGILQAFISVGGTLTSFSVPGASLTLAYQLNNSNQLVVGCTSRSILRAPLRQSCLEITIGTGWWADMRTAQA